MENKEVPRYFDTYVKSSIELGTIIFCEYDKRNVGVNIKSVPSVNDLIRKNIMQKDAIPTQKAYLHDIIGV